MMEVVYSRLPCGRTGISSVEEVPLEWFDYRRTIIGGITILTMEVGDYRGILAIQGNSFRLFAIQRLETHMANPLLPSLVPCHVAAKDGDYG